MTPPRLSLHLAPTREEVDRSRVERQHLGSLLRRAHFLTYVFRDTAHDAESPQHVATRRELEAILWALAMLGGAWGLAVSASVRDTLTHLTRTPERASGD